MIKTRLLSVSFPGGGYGSVAANREKMVMYLEKAGAYQPDFVCFTEVARELGVPRDSEEWKGEPIPGPTTEALGSVRKPHRRQRLSVARKYRTHVIVGMQERAGDRTFNAAALIGRDGAVMGVFARLTDAKGLRYHKVQPTIGEMEGGTVPGTEAQTWETDRGRVGM